MLAQSGFEAGARVFFQSILPGKIPKENLWGREGVCGGCPYQDGCPMYKQLFEWVPVYPGFEGDGFTGSKYEQVKMLDKCPMLEMMA